MADFDENIIINVKVEYQDALKSVGRLKTENDLLKASESKLKEELATLSTLWSVTISLLTDITMRFFI